MKDGRGVSGEALFGILMRDVAHPVMQLEQGDSCVHYAGTGLRRRVMLKPRYYAMVYGLWIGNRSTIHV